MGMQEVKQANKVLKKECMRISEQSEQGLSLFDELNFHGTNLRNFQEDLSAEIYTETGV